MVRRIRLLPIVITAAALILFSVPFVYLIVVTFVSPESYYSGNPAFSLVNIRLITNPDFLKAISVSLVSASVGAVLSVCITVSAAYGFYLFYSQRTYILPKAGKTLLSLFLFILIFNGGVIPLYMVVRYLGLVDTIWSLFVPYLMHYIMVFYCLEQLRKIPLSIIEAARLQGANDLAVFFRLVLPLKAGVFLSLLLIHFVLHWNNWYPGVLFIHSTRKQPVQIFLRNLLTTDQVFENLGVTKAMLSPPERMAYTLFSLVPAAIAFVLSIRIAGNQAAKEY